MDVVEQRRRKPVQRATSSQENKIGALLYTHLHNTQEGFAIYDDGWSDARIAAEVGVDEKMVTYRRQNDKEFNRLQSAGKVLDADNTALRSWLYELTTKHNEVVQILIERIAHGNTDRIKLLNNLKVKHLIGDHRVTLPKD